MSSLTNYQDKLEPDVLQHMGGSPVELSVAISAKRIADALERLARSEYRGAILTHARGGK